MTSVRVSFTKKRNQQINQICVKKSFSFSSLVRTRYWSTSGHADMIEGAFEALARKEEIIIALAINDALAFRNEVIINLQCPHQRKSRPNLKYNKINNIFSRKETISITKDWKKMQNVW